MREIVESYRRVSGPPLSQRFIELLLEFRPTLAPRFAEADPEQLNRLLDLTLCAMIRAASGVTPDRDHGPAISLARGLGPGGTLIPEQHVDTWRECLIIAIGECDPEATPPLVTQWRQVITDGMMHLARLSSGSGGPARAA